MKITYKIHAFIFENIGLM